jgi:hypothetical protein
MGCHSLCKGGGGAGLSWAACLVMVSVMVMVAHLTRGRLARQWRKATHRWVERGEGGGVMVFGGGDGGDTQTCPR